MAAVADDPAALAEMDFVLDDDETAPFAANEENRKLDKEIKLKERKLLDVESQQEEQQNRIKAIKEHLQSLQQEQQHVQALLLARGRESDSEKHLQILSEKERQRLEKEVSRTKQQIQELTDRINSDENNIVRFSKQLDETRLKMEWNQEELDEWMEQARTLDSDADLLEKYTREDNARIKELTLAIEKLTEQRDKHKRAVEHEALETKSARVALDKAAQEFRQTYEEHQDITKRWQEVIQQMEQRDFEIEEQAQVFRDLRRQAAQKQAAVREQGQYLVEEKRNNREIEQQIRLADRDKEQIQTQLNRAEQKLADFEDELASLRTALSATSGQVASKRREVADMKDRLQDRQAKAERLEQQIMHARQQLENADSSKIGAEERTRQLQSMLDEDEAEYKQIQTQLRDLRNQYLLATQRSKEVEDQQSLMASKLAGLASTRDNLRARLKTVQREAEQQEKQVYELDYKITSLQRRFDKLDGKRSKEEERKFRQQVSELEGQLEQEKKTGRLLQQQILKVETEIRHARRHADDMKATVSRYENALQELEMACQAADTELQQLVNAKQDVLVDENVLKLEVRKVRAALHRRADKVMSLEQQRASVQDAMKERFMEVGMHKEMLTAQIRDADNDRTNAMKDWKERISRIEQLKKRYEIIVMSMTPSDEKDEEKGHAYYVVKAAQEREELQRQGDKLDNKIRKGEKELRALENTLRLMDSRNATLRSTLTKTDGLPGSESSTKEKLEAQYQTAMDKFKHKRRELQESREDLDALEEALEVARQQEAAAMSDVRQLELSIRDVDRELEDQAAKMSRAQRQAASMHRRRLQQGVAADQLDLEEADLKYRTVRDFNARMFETIENAVAPIPEAETKLNLLLDQLNIKPPKRQGAPSSSLAGTSSRGSSVAGSSVSGMSSRMSSRGATPRGRDRTTADNASMARQKQVVSSRTVQISLPPLPVESRSGERASPQRQSRPRSGSSRPMSSRSSTSSRASRVSNR